MARSDCCCCCHPTATPGERQPLSRDSWSQHLSAVTLLPNTSASQVPLAPVLGKDGMGLVPFLYLPQIFFGTWIIQNLCTLHIVTITVHFFLFHCCFVYFKSVVHSSEALLLYSFSPGGGGVEREKHIIFLIILLKKQHKWKQINFSF